MQKTRAIELEQKAQRMKNIEVVSSRIYRWIFIPDNVIRSNDF